MYANEDYRPGYNPQFVAEVHARRKLEQAKRRARLLKHEQAISRAVHAPRLPTEAEVVRLETLAARKAAAAAQIENANRVLMAMRGEAGRIPFATIVRRFCRAMGVSKAELDSPSRVRRIVFCRQAITYWARRRTNMSLPTIGYRLGGFDHTTCLWSIKTYPQKRAAQGRFVRTVG